jgi:hypothetical protein
LKGKSKFKQPRIIGKVQLAALVVAGNKFFTSNQPFIFKEVLTIDTLEYGNMDNCLK